MADITMDQAELERAVEAKLREVAGERQQPNGALNVRPESEGGEPEGRTTRGGDSFFTRGSKLKPDEAKNIMRFFRGINQGDFASVREASTALNDGATVERLQQVGNTTDGGVTVPYQFLHEVTIALPRVTPFADANIVRIIPMQSETTRWTKVTAKPSQPSTIQEGAAYPTTGVSFGLIELVARKIGEIIPLTEEILESNQIGMVQVIAELVAEQLGYKRNGLVTRGNGVSEPEGVMVNGNIAAFTWDATNAGTKADSVIGMFHSLKSQYRNDAIWLFADSTIKYVRTLKDSYGRYLWTDGFNDRPATLLGRPVFENSDMNASEGLFGNFRRGYVIGERDGLLVERNSSGTDWTKDIVNFKFRQRYDGKVNDEQAFVKTTTIA